MRVSLPSLASTPLDYVRDAGRLDTVLRGSGHTFFVRASSLTWDVITCVYHTVICQECKRMTCDDPEREAEARRDCRALGRPGSSRAGMRYCVCGHGNPSDCRGAVAPPHWPHPNNNRIDATRRRRAMLPAALRSARVVSGRYDTGAGCYTSRPMLWHVGMAVRKIGTNRDRTQYHLCTAGNWGDLRRVRRPGL